MTQRIDLSTTPGALRAVVALDEHVHRAIDTSLLHLVKLRASIINGCTFCIDMHSTEAIDDGDDPRRIHAIAAWAESPFFSHEERAALALTDAVTTLGSDGVSDEVWSDAVAAFDDQMVVELVVAIAAINVWNRLAIATRLAPPPLTS